MTRKPWAFFVFLTLAVAPAVAQSDDPPERVARLNFLSGSVSFRPGSVEEWTGATLNYPLTTGDHLWADTDSMTEIHVGSTAIRMASQTAMSFLNLDDRATQISLTQGTLHIRVRSLADDEMYEIDTPNVAVTLLRPGDYRIDADGDNNVTVVAVRSGDAEVTGGGAAFSIHPRQSARIAGTDSVSQEITALAPRDNFDAWCETREQREGQSQISARYVPRDMVGYEDLDAYGAWHDDPAYGPVWAPRSVAEGWAPYRFGRWAWVDPWGWTWIDDAPWGFAPFHYGRWAFAGGGWVWAPGRLVVGVRPVYAPALVAFVGGPRFGVSMAAWFPLGPGEVYRPAYRVSEVYVRQVNITHVTNINVTNVRYVNQNVAGGVTVVSHETFASARPVGREVIRVDAREISQAQVVGATASIAPRRESVLARAGAPSAPPPRFAGRAVVARTPPPPPRVSFAAQQQALQANQGRPLEPSQVNSLRSTAPVSRPAVRTVQGPPPGRPQYQGQPNVTPPPPNIRDSPRFERPVPPARTEQPQPAGQPNVAPPPPNIRDSPRFERPATPARTEQPQPAVQPNVAPPPRRYEQPQPAVQPDNAPPPRRYERPQPAAQPDNAPPPRRYERPQPAAQPDNAPPPRRYERPQPPPPPSSPPPPQPQRPQPAAQPAAAPPPPPARTEHREERKAEKKKDEKKDH